MEQAVRDVIAENLLDDSGKKVLAEMGNDESLVEAGLLDSLGMVQLIEHLSKAFDVTFDAMDMAIENLETVDMIVELVQSKK